MNRYNVLVTLLCFALAAESIFAQATPEKMDEAGVVSYSAKDTSGDCEVTLSLLKRPDDQGTYAVLAGVKNVSSRPLTLTMARDFNPAFGLHIYDAAGTAVSPELRQYDHNEEQPMETIALAPGMSRYWLVSIASCLIDPSAFKPGNYRFWLGTDLGRSSNLVKVMSQPEAITKQSLETSPEKYVVKFGNEIFDLAGKAVKQVAQGELNIITNAEVPSVLGGNEKEP